MHEILYLLRAVVLVFVIILVYGIVSLLIVPIDYGFAEPFIDTGIFLFFPVVIFLPAIAEQILDFVYMLESTVSNGNGIFSVLFFLVVVFVYTMVIELIYNWLKKRDKKRYEYEI